MREQARTGSLGKIICWSISGDIIAWSYRRDMLGIKEGIVNGSHNVDKGTIFMVSCETESRRYGNFSWLAVQIPTCQLFMTFITFNHFYTPTSIVSSPSSAPRTLTPFAPVAAGGGSTTPRPLPASNSLRTSGPISRWPLTRIKSNSASL